MELKTYKIVEITILFQLPFFPTILSEIRKEIAPNTRRFQRCEQLRSVNTMI
jgi:hypothetical protein